MTLATACRWLLPYRPPTPWAAWLRERRAAVSTLQRLGYTHHGGELWKPPLGPIPDFAQPLLDDDGRPVTVRGRVWYLPEDDA